MKSIAYTLKALITIYIFLLWQGDVGAVLWEDQFEKASKDDWQHVGNDSVWTV